MCVRLYKRMLASPSEVPRASSLAKPSLQSADYPGHERGKMNIFLLGDPKRGER